MDTWQIIISFALATYLILSLSLISAFGKKSKLPPSPFTFPIIGSYFRLSNLESLLRSLRIATNNSPLLSLPYGPHNVIIVADRYAAHSALIDHGSSLASRPKSLTHNASISSSPYGDTWRLYRRNIIQLVHRRHLFSSIRRQALRSLLCNLKTDNPVTLVSHLQFSMFSILAAMCFGDLTEAQIKQIEETQRDLLMNFHRRFNILFFFPKLTKFFPKLTKIFLGNKLPGLRAKQASVLLPIINSRREFLKQGRHTSQENLETASSLAYVDNLLDLEVPEKGRKLNENEILNLCGEFLEAGTDNSVTSIQWIMANLVKYPNIQNKLYEEIKGIVGDKTEVAEEDLSKMKYLKAVILEALRRHPPAHFLLHHIATDDVELEGYTIPKGTMVNFMVADIGWDPEVWENPMEFRPERFMGDDVAELDLTGGKEIKMMPFGAGRRLCPGMKLGMLHLDYFIANLVWAFEWKIPEGEEVDMTEKQELSIVMKNPLRVCLSPRV